MVSAEGKDDAVTDFEALNEELFGETGDDESKGCRDRSLLCHDMLTGGHGYLPSLHPKTTSSKKSGTALQLSPQITTTSQSPPSFPTTPVSLIEGRQQHVTPVELHDDRSLCPEIAMCASTTYGPENLVSGNISWMKNRITDVHQLLLHYLNLRDAHQALATDLQREMILRVENQEALESIRDQQDQASEDFPKLQFQIAQLRLDLQKERTARVVAETGFTNIKEKVTNCAAEYVMMMEARVSECQAKEEKWLAELAELKGQARDLVEGSVTNQYSIEQV